MKAPVGEPVTSDSQDVRIADPADGRLTFRVEQLHIHLGFVVLLVSALVLMFMPDRWFESDDLQLLADWSRSISGKLENDGAFLESRGIISASKYIAFVLYCVAVVLLVSLIMCPATCLAIRGSSRPLNLSQLSALWKTLIALLIVVYLAIFDIWFLRADARVSRGIANSPLLWIWTALLWGALSTIIAGVTILLAKILKHGFPKVIQKPPRSNGRVH